MSGSNNLPVGIDASAAFADLDRQVANLGRTFAAQAAPVGTLNTALGQTQERLGQLEQSTQRAQRAVGELRGAMELIGASGVAGPLGQVAATIGNVADVMATAGRAGGVFSTVMQTVGRAIVPVGVAIAGVTIATTDWNAATERLRGTIQGMRGVFYDMAQATAGYQAGIDRLTASLLTAEQAERRRAQAAREAMVASLNNDLTAGNVQLSAAERRLAELQPIADQVRLAREIGGPDTVIAGAAGRRFADYERVAEDVRRLREQRATLEGGIRDLQSVPIFSPAAVPPPSAPTGARGGGGGGELDISGMVQRNVERAAAEELRARQRANDLIAQDERRLLDQRERQNERTTDAIVNYAGERFADLFSETGRGWAGLMESLRRTALATFARIAAEAVIRPIIAPVVSSLGLGTLTGGDGAGGGGLGLGGIAQALGLGSSINSLTGGGLLNSLGLSGGVSGLLSTPLWGSSTAAAGMFAEASAASMGLSGSQAAGMAGLGPSLGSLLGVAGLGFAGGGLLASLTGGNSVGGGIGGALGAGAGFLLGGPLGALIGGAAGGGLGGLFGNNNRAFSGGDALVGRTNDGFLTLAGYAGKNFDSGDLMRQTQAEVDQINALLRAANIRVTSGQRANVGGGGSPNASTVLGAIQQFGFGFSSDNARINQAIQPFGSNLEGALGVAQWITQLDQLTASLNGGTNAIRQITQQFDAAFETARRYGIGLEEVQRAQNAALGALIAPSIGGLADTLAAARLGADSPLSPRARAAAAQAEVSQLAARARGGDLTAYGRLQSATQTALAVNREVFGGGAAGVAGFNSILEKIEELVGGGAEALTAALYTAEMRSQTDVLSAEIQRLRAEVAGLRADMGQATRMPDRLR